MPECHYTPNDVWPKHFFSKIPLTLSPFSINIAKLSVTIPNLAIHDKGIGRIGKIRVYELPSIRLSGRSWKMPKLIKQRSKKAGLAPGALVHIGEKKAGTPKITLMDYDEAYFQEKEIKTIEECLLLKDKATMTWMNVDGLHQIDILEKIGGCYGLHPLVLEDILNTEQRPKMEDYDEYMFFVLKMIYCRDKNGDMETEQVSIILGSNFVISFQEREGDVFNTVRDRIRKSKGRIRKSASDYLAYALLDAIVDNYFIILEKHGEKIETLEEELTVEATERTQSA